MSNSSHWGGFICGLFPSFTFLPSLNDRRWSTAKRLATKMGIIQHGTKPTAPAAGRRSGAGTGASSGGGPKSRGTSDAEPSAAPGGRSASGRARRDDVRSGGGISGNSSERTPAASSLSPSGISSPVRRRRNGSEPRSGGSGAERTPMPSSPLGGRSRRTAAGPYGPSFDPPAAVVEVDGDCVSVSPREGRNRARESDGGDPETRGGGGCGGCFSGYAARRGRRASVGSLPPPGGAGSAAEDVKRRRRARSLGAPVLEGDDEGGLLRCWGELRARRRRSRGRIRGSKNTKWRWTRHPFALIGIIVMGGVFIGIPIYLYTYKFHNLQCMA